MPAILIRHRVADYDAWRRVFDQQAHARTANGCQQVHVFRNAAEPQDRVTLLTWDTLVRARLYTQSDDWLESLHQGGVTSCPAILFLDDAQ